MPRLFIAIELPQAVRDQIARLKRPIPTARWVRPEHMHITVRFIGNVEAAQIETALDGVNGESFALTLRGTGRFPPSRKKAPRVLWVGLEDAPALVNLHHAVNAALESVGIPPDHSHGFNPHLTLARLRTHNPAPEATAFLKQTADFRLPPVTVDEFVLIESILTPHGPQYTIRRRYTLT
jgi:RNA 2',3'-cyclic 3'-phosphodiesterase